jgi:hypothetical protein
MRLTKSGGAAESVVEGQNRCLLSLFVNETAVVWQAEIPSLDFEHPDPCIDTATCTSVFKLAK